jgi:hypothetical protein
MTMVNIFPSTIEDIKEKASAFVWRSIPDRLGVRTSHGDWASHASTLTAISDTDVNIAYLTDRDLPSILSRDIVATSSMSGFAIFSG